MELKIEFWQLLGLALTVGGAFVGALKLLADQFLVRMDERFASISKDLDAHMEQERRTQERLDQIERDMMGLRAELPERYLRREDHIRSQSTIEAKLDALAGKLELAQMRGANER
jgi:hypothetical protein